jgi:hypothetical protein
MEFGGDDDPAVRLVLAREGKDVFFRRSDTGARVSVEPVTRHGIYSIVVLNGCGEYEFSRRVDFAAQQHRPDGANIAYLPLSPQENASRDRRKLHQVPVGLQYFHLLDV